MNKFLLGVLILFTFNLSPNFLSFAQGETPKQSYAQLQGQVLNEWRKPVGGVSVALTPVANGYSTTGGSAITDVNGYYTMSNIPKYLYSSGPEPKPVDYYVTVNYPGYELHTSEPFNFKDSSSITKDIRLDKEKNSY